MSRNERPSFQLVGFASVSGYGSDKTTGGRSGKVIEVHNAKEFQAAVERSEIARKADRENVPLVVKVMADIDLEALNNEKPGNDLKSVGKVGVASNTTIYGSGAGATIHHGVLEVHGAHNIVIRNLRFRDLWENDPTGKYDKLGWDYIRIVNSGKTHSHHVWVDHCDFGKAYDGQCDITHGSDLVTVSWCHFAGDLRGPHKKSMLIGHSSSANASATDIGHLNVTLHHNWFENIEDRAPRVRFGNVHAFDNYVDGAANATISVMHATTLVENCVYHDTRIATTFSHASDSQEKGRGGRICIVNSLNLEPRKASSATGAKDEFEVENNFKENVQRAKLSFNPVTDWAWKDLTNPPYPYQPDPVDGLPTLLQKFAGTGKLTEADLAATEP